MSQPIQAVIFDKDGTLHDTERLFHIAWQRAAKDLNVPDIEATMQACTGRAIPGIAAYWAEKYPTISFDEYLPRRQMYFNELLDEGVPVKAGALQLLAYLKARGYRVGLATSCPYEDAMEHLARSGMTEYFDAVVGGDMVDHSKPAPDIYLRAAHDLRVDPKHCVGVEDSINGICSIHNAGMRPIFVPDIIEFPADVASLVWARCDCLADIIPLLEGQET